MTPTPDQILLLRACLLSGGEAAAAWKTWRERINFDDIDAASYRLVPLLYKNLRRENIEDELLGRLKGIYRHTWSRNQLLFHEAGRVLKAMNDAGISVLVLKGATLAGSFYLDAGLRPMNDFDFMVPLAGVSRAVAVMEQSGWHCAESVSPARLVECSHAGKWTNSNGQQMDMHWHLLPEGRQLGLDDDVWTRAVTMEIGGGKFSGMNATDLLWHVCAHGAIGDEIPAIRWVADAWTILQGRREKIDWQQFVLAVQHRQLTLAAGRALVFLREEFNAPVPAQIIAELRGTPPAWLERWADRIKSRPPGLLGALPLHLVNYLRLTRHDNLWRRLTGAPAFFQRVWGVPTMGGLPVYVAKKAADRLALSKR
ncbi:MAG: nucleotidyltransferase family protein [Limisphaerales bacterium]